LLDKIVLSNIRRIMKTQPHNIYDTGQGTKDNSGLKTQEVIRTGV